MAETPTREQELAETVTSPGESPYKKQRVASDANLKLLLLNTFARDEEAAASALDDIEFKRDPAFSTASRILKAGNLESRGESPSGLKAMEIPQGFCDRFGGELFILKVRSSRLYFERSCYPSLFDTLMECLRTEKAPKIILTGNAGIGKSWFQVYFLQRLFQMAPSERPDNMPRFVLTRQYKKKFYLLDLKTCEAWKMLKKTRSDMDEGEVEDFLAAFRNIFYMLEPGQDQSIIPLDQADTPSFSILSPNPTRLAGYEKQATPTFFILQTGHTGNYISFSSSRTRVQGLILTASTINLEVLFAARLNTRKNLRRSMMMSLINESKVLISKSSVPCTLD